MGKQTTALSKRVVSSTTQVIMPSGLTVNADYAQILLENYQFISNSALKVGAHIVAAVGVGKSTLLSNFAWHQLRQEKPAVILDPTGGVTDQLFAKLIRLPPEQQVPLWQRIVYILPGNKESLFPSPLYYDLSKNDTFFEIANRFPSVLKRIDPELRRAPILGTNALEECAIDVGEIAAALGQQLDFIADLIDYPSKYKVQLRQVVTDHPGLQQAVEYFRKLMDPTSSGLREKKTGSFKNKLLPFLAHPIRMATYAAKNNRLNWKKLIQDKVVVIDYREELDQDHLQFDMVWHFKGFMDAIKYRGAAGRGHEVMLIIDEITSLLGQRTHDGHSILAEDLQGLISRYGRAYGVNTIIAHQGLYQVDEQIQDLLMGMGNQIVGQLSSPDDAVRVARQFMRYNPYLVKKTENVYFARHVPPLLESSDSYSMSVPGVIDEHTIEFTPEEQLLQWVNKIMDLDRYQFYAQIATSEGGKKGPVRKITIAKLDTHQYPNEAILAPLRQALAQRDGIPREKLLAEIQASRIEATPEKKLKPPKQPAKELATMENDHDKHPIPTPALSQSGEPSDDSRSAAAAPSGSADFWEPRPAKTD